MSNIYIFSTGVFIMSYDLIIKNTKTYMLSCQCNILELIMNSY